MDAARRKVEIFSQMGLVMIGQEDILAAIDLHAAHQTSFWDALLIRSASRSGCSLLYTEDLQHGQRFGDLQVINPFL